MIDSLHPGAFEALRLRVFAYGTLMFDEVMEAVVGRRFEGVPAQLPGYERYQVRGQSYPAIVRRDEGMTEGILFSGIDEETLARLDRFEGSSYQREWVALDTGERAWAYVVAPGKEPLLSDQPWNPDEFLREHGEAFVEAWDPLRVEGVE